MRLSSWIFLLLLIIGSMGWRYVKPQALAKKKIVYVDMTGDLFHPGHVKFLEKAKNCGDYLIVGLVSDEDAQAYNKRRPYMNLAERVELVKNCRFVDEVLPGCPYRLTDELLDERKIDCVVHGDDYSHESLYYYYQPAIDRGIFKTVSYTRHISTSELIERVQKRSLESLNLESIPYVVDMTCD